MDRLQKKCVVASAGLHGLLAATLLFGAAFLAPSSKTENMEVLTVIPDVLTDAPSSNAGGNPNVRQAPPPAPLLPTPQPPAPAPPPSKTAPEVKPEPVVPKSAPPKESEEPDFTKPATGHRVAVSANKITVKTGPRARASEENSDAADERAAAKAAADARNRARAALQGAVRSIGDVASSSTSVEVPGPGGQAYANYSQVVKSIYTQAWIVPADVDDDQAIAKASVVIAKDGTVISARIISRSGNAGVDASVQRTLERVTFIAPFPVGAKEDKRTFTISFNLKAKRQLG